MIFAFILLMTILNIILGTYYFGRFMRQRSLIGLLFTIYWISDYVVGNILLLSVKDVVFGFKSFEGFEDSYLFSLVVGVYFLIIYAHLIRNWGKYSQVNSGYPKCALPVILAFFGIAILFATLFIYNVGISSYFSDEMARYRINLGDYAGHGIGTYYYLAMLLFSAVIMIIFYSFNFPFFRNIVLSTIAVAMALIVFMPIGGRGRLINIFMVLFIGFMALRKEYRVSKLFHPKNILLFSFLLTVAYLWGVIRDNHEEVVSAEMIDIIKATAVDLTRLSSQSFIFENYPIEGVYWGAHYIESILGPFTKYLPFGNVNLIPEVSSLWYYDTIGGINIKSAISPSFLGEIYLNFGIIGLASAPFLFYLIILFSIRIFSFRHPLSLAVIAYMFQFNFFHGGMYGLFDLFVYTLPLLLINKYLYSKVNFANYVHISSNSAYTPPQTKQS